MAEINIVILCGPSASGKDAILTELLKETKYNFKKVVTYTSRPNSRDFEKAGFSYHYLTKEDFEEKIKSGFFLEHMETHGYLYGTPKNAFSSSGNYIMQIDIRGALEVKRSLPNTLIIFIDVPKDQLIQRLKKRGETDKMIDVRMDTADNEFKSMVKADMIIDNPNGSFKQTLLKAKSTLDKFLSMK